MATVEMISFGQIHEFLSLPKGDFFFFFLDTEWSMSVCFDSIPL